MWLSVSEKNNGACEKMFFKQIHNPSFFSVIPLWNQYKTTNKEFTIPHKNQFVKFGKILGMKTVRFLEIENDDLFYFENAKDKTSKGTCNFKNLYLETLEKGNQNSIILSNGYDFTHFHFDSLQIYKSVLSKMLKHSVQLRFHQKYFTSTMLGQGSFSKIYLAQKKGRNGHFAAKIVPKICSTGFETKSMIQQQKRILCHMDNERICKYYEFFQQNDNFILILESLSGKDLNKIFKENTKLSFNEIKFILKQTLEGLNYLQRINVVHRDLKPHNIIVDLKKRKIKIIDFGLSMMYDQKTKLDKFIRCGTMGYIAPQIVNNSVQKRKKYDTKSDIFSFGIIAHMLLLGNNPLKAKTYSETVTKNMEGNVQLDKKLILSKYGEDCFNFLNSLIQKDPKMRASASQALKSNFFKQKSINQNLMISSRFKGEQQNNNVASKFNLDNQDGQYQRLNRFKSDYKLKKRSTKASDKQNQNLSTLNSEKSPTKFSGIH